MAWLERVRADWQHWDFVGGLRRPMPDALAARYAEDQDAFDIRFLEDVLARLGEDQPILAHLGYLYTRVGRYRDGLAVDRRLCALRPRDAGAHYNLACSYSLLKQTSRAFMVLRKAVQLGYRDYEHMQADPDLENLRADPRWNDLLGVLNR